MKNCEYVYGFHAINALLQAQPELIIEIALIAERNDQRCRDLMEKAKELKIILRQMNRDAFTKWIGSDVVHQGVAARCHVFTGLDESVLRDLVANTEARKLILVLDGVQDPHNLGACLRTANGFNVQAVVTTKDRASGLTPVVRKVACGAAELTPFIQVTNLARTLQWLAEQGIWIVGMTGDAERRIQDIDLTGDIAIVMGNEAKGLRELTQKQCDYLAKIPMSGFVSSFNVSVATGICLYEVARQRN